MTAHSFHINHLNISISFLLILMFPKIQAQSSTDFLQDYLPVSAHSSFIYFAKGKTTMNVSNSPVTMYPDHVASLEIGGNILLFNKSKFLVYTGMFYRYLFNNVYYHIDEDQNTIITDWYMLSNSGEKIVSFPLRLEYLFYKKYFMYTAGSFGFFRNYGGLTGNGDSGITILQYETITKNWFYFNMEIGIGKYLKTKYILLQPYIYYNKSFHNILEEKILITGIKNRGYTEIRGKMEQSGNFVGIGLNIFPKKWWK